jgi:aminoglycoside 3-N-acetyltransferase
MNARDILRNLVPAFALSWNRKRKKERLRKKLEAKRAAGSIWTAQKLISAFKEAGIDSKKDLLVHSSLSKIGYVEGGASTVVHALLEFLEPTSTLLMPTSPVVTLQAEHDLDVFDVANTPSKMGSITEFFRSTIPVHRSAHPLEPVAAYGPRAKEYTELHHTDATAYGVNSPWLKHMEFAGQILYLGTTLINSGTSLHAVEDFITHEKFKFPIYLDRLRTFQVVLEGRRLSITSTVHNPEWSRKRQCDGLIHLLEKNGCLKRIVIGEAPSLLVDAAKMKSILLEEYSKRGVTMYTPQGS